MRGVRRNRPQPVSRIVAVLACLIGLAAIWAAYELGQLRGGHNRYAASEREAELLAELSETQQRNRHLSERAAMLETDSKVKAEAYRQVEQRLRKLQGEIQRQAEDIAFYRGIVGDQQAGLRVQDFGLFPGVEPEEISLRLVLAQALRDGRRVKGTVELTVSGQRDGKAETLGLDQLGLADQQALEFSFRYFQNLQASIRLPADFSPEKVTVLVRPSSKGIEPVEASYDWELRRG